VRLRTSAAVRRLFPPLTALWYSRLTKRAALVASIPHRRASDFIVSAGEADDAASLSHRAQLWAAGDVEYLNRRERVGSPRHWRSVDAPRLFRYHLQYFDELPDLAVTGPPQWIFELLREWIESHPIGIDPDAWHPFVASVRCVNWMQASAILAARGVIPPDDVLQQMRRDAVFVSRNLETDVGGNHLIKNVKALAFASVWWSGAQAEAWRNRAIELWVHELDRQVLEDGAHYELSPMYHCQVLSDLLETVAVLGAAHYGIPCALVTSARRMMAFLDVVCHPDGDIALFNDSTFTYETRPSTLRSFAAAVLDGGPALTLPPRLRLLAGAVHHPLRIEGADAPRSSTASGFVRLDSSDRRLVLIADAGPVCPDDLPAHAHADLLSFEVSIDGRRVIVDSGVADYEAGPWRDFWRSTRAHNTVVVDGTEQSECWGSFRVARRARPVRVVQQRDSDAAALSASHTGYLRLRPPVEHRRTIALVRDRFWIVVDELLGSGRHSWTSCLHFHPDVRVDLHSSQAIAAVAESGLSIRWTESLRGTAVRGAEAPLQGWYAPRFGERLETTALLLSGSGTLPVRFAYVIAPVCSHTSVSWEDERHLAVDIGSERFRIGLPTPERERVLTVA
jgi:uncharacterized heparinase superfamily protein